MCIYIYICIHIHTCREIYHTYILIIHTHTYSSSRNWLKEYSMATFRFVCHPRAGATVEENMR